MTPGPKPTRVPRVPALVRRRVAAITIGVGLGGSLACGGLETVATPTPVPQPPVPPQADGSADALQSPDVAEARDVLIPPLDSGNDADVVSDVILHAERFEPPCGIPK
jgi:hypothetical protein